MTKADKTGGAVSEPGVDSLKLIVAFGGYLSLGYLLGYAYWWAYLDVFGATVVISQVPVVDIFFGSIAGFVPLLTFVTGYFLERKTSTLAEPAIIRLIAGAACVSVVIAVADFFAGDFFIEEARSFAFGITAVCIAVSAAACAQLTWIAWRNRAWASLVLRALIFAALAFLLCPAAAGLSNGFFDVANAEYNLATILLTEKRSVHVLFFTNEHVIGVTQPTLRARQILVVPWSSIQGISGVRHFRRDRSGDRVSKWLYE
jgi:hypothetical protein